MSDSHTPTPRPWHIDPRFCLHIWGPDKEMVADFEQSEAEDAPEKSFVSRIRGFGADLPQQANANHIVTCVNAHDELVAALEIAILEFESDRRWKTALGSDYYQDPKWVTDARAALAKAKENN